MSEVVYEDSIYNSDGYRMYIQFFIFPLPMESKKPSSGNGGNNSYCPFICIRFDRHIFYLLKIFDINIIK